MRFRTDERQRLADIIHEEIDATHRRVEQRLSELDRSAAVSGTSLDGVRRFYQDLSDTQWTIDDEEALAALGVIDEMEIKRMMREGFRRLRVQPVPSFASLIIALRKNPAEPVWDAMPTDLANHDAVPAAERERIANILHRELDEAARLIASRLKLADTKFIWFASSLKPLREP
jgi:hypothetical protein